MTPRSPITKGPPDGAYAQGAGPSSIIETTIFCAACGCNLKGHGLVGACPDCGTAYTARRGASPTVHLPGLADFPWTRLLILIFAGTVAPLAIALWLSLGRHVLLPIVNFIPLAAILAGGLAVYQLPLCLRDLYHYVRHRSWECRHRESIAEDRRRREAHRAVAALAETPVAPDRPFRPLTDATLERLTLEGFMTPIDWDALCANCGYRLRGLPRKGICPECGTAYNARTHLFENILTPNVGPRSGVNGLLAFACGSISMLLFRSMLVDFYVFKLFCAILFAAGAYAYAALAFRLNRRYRLARRALKQIEAEEEDA